MAEPSKASHVTEEHKAPAMPHPKTDAIKGKGKMVADTDKDGY